MCELLWNAGDPAVFTAFCCRCGTSRSSEKRGHECRLTAATAVTRSIGSMKGHEDVN